MLFDNSLTLNAFRYQPENENGYEKGCTRGANFFKAPPTGGLFRWQIAVESPRPNQILHTVP